MRPEKQFGYGLFIRNDENGNPIRIGDEVRIVRRQIGIENNSDYFKPEWSIQGRLKLYRTMGIVIKRDGASQPTLIKTTDRCRNRHEWYLVGPSDDALQE